MKAFRLTLCSVLLAAFALPLAAAPSTMPVNTFIGTQDEGNTFPGASAPFGMIQVSPTGEHYAGWHYSDARIRGFGHSFLSGAGCWEQGGQLSVLPVTGSIGPGGDFDTKKAESFNYKRYAAEYTHEGEVGQAGYYKVNLTSYCSRYRQRSRSAQPRPGQRAPFRGWQRGAGTG
jgi:putative alpha-1,2-mannosidase